MVRVNAVIPRPGSRGSNSPRRPGHRYIGSGIAVKSRARTRQQLASWGCQAAGLGPPAPRQPYSSDRDIQLVDQMGAVVPGHSHGAIIELDGWIHAWAHRRM